MMNPPEEPKAPTPVHDHLGGFMLWSRYTLVPMYVGLASMMLVYVFTFFAEIVRVLSEPNTFGVTEKMLLVFLGLMDMTMIANLMVMTTVGGYSIFVNELKPTSATLPRFLNRLTSGTLKVKMSGSLIGVSSVHLLARFKDVEHLDMATLTPQLWIHFAFMVSAIVFAWIEGQMHPTHQSLPDTKPMTQSPTTHETHQ